MGGTKAKNSKRALTVPQYQAGREKHKITPLFTDTERQQLLNKIK